MKREGERGTGEREEESQGGRGEEDENLSMSL